jgi:hypothetical protein
MESDLVTLKNEIAGQSKSCLTLFKTHQDPKLMNLPFCHSLFALIATLGITTLLFSDPSAAKKPEVKSPQILRGIYWYRPIGVNLEIVGNRFRYNSDSSAEPGSWIVISKLRYVKQGVVIDPNFKSGDSAPYWCLSTFQKNSNENCTKDGWRKGAE